MKVIVETAKLIDIIDITTRFVAKNATLPILQNIYIKANIDNLIIRATDMEKYIEIEMPATIKVEWAITVNAKTFSDIIRAIEEKEVEISVDQKTQIMNIKSHKDTFDINGISASEYVALPEVPRDNTISLETKAFSEGIDKVEYAVTEKNFSPILTWVLLKAKKGTNTNELVFVGTDSFRIAEYKTELIGEASEFSLIIPKVSINDIKKIAEYALQKESDKIQVQYSDNLIAFQYTIDNMKILAISLLIQGNFPDYEREEIMPKTFNTKVMVDKNLCDKAIKKIGILTRDINNFIQIQTDKDSIVISSGKTDKWAGTTSIPAIIEGEEITFGINGRYITDFTKSIQGDELVLNIVDSQKPIIIKDKDENNYKYIVRPLIQ